MDEQLKLLLDNDEFVAKLLSKEEPEDVQKLFSDNGVEMTLDEVRAIGRALDKVDAKSGEISEDDLEEVAGGFGAIAVIGIIAITCISTATLTNWDSISGYFRRW